MNKKNYEKKEISAEKNTYLIGKQLFESRQYEPAITYFRRAVEQNLYSAYFYLGICYKYEFGIQGQREKAEKMFENWYAAYHQDDSVHGKLVWTSYCMLNGYGTEKNIPQAIENLKAAAEVKDAYAGLIVGRAYENGCFQQKPDVNNARCYLEKSAALGCVEALYELSLFYQKHGMGKYEAEARKIFDQITEQLIEAAQKNPGRDTYYQLYRHFCRGCVGRDSKETEKLARQYQEF